MLEVFSNNIFFLKMEAKNNLVVCMFERDSMAPGDTDQVLRACA